MKKRKFICTILILVCLTGITAGVYQIYKQLHEYSEGDRSYTELDDYIRMPEEPDNSEQESQSGEAGDKRQWPAIDFAALKEINSDIVGWIYIEGTKINYPIVQGKDNQYYLKHLFSGEWNSSGCIFLDSRNASDFLDRHSIVYGHHMKNGAMFSGLMEYKKQEYYDSHPVALILTPDRNYEVELFAGYVAGVDAPAWETAFSSDSDFTEWLTAAKERSCFTSSITPAVTDKIITLSTCSYEFNNARFVLLGILKQEN